MLTLLLKKLLQLTLKLVKQPIFAYSVLAIVLYLFSTSAIQHAKEIKVLNKNYEAVVYDSHIQQSLTLSQYKKYNSDLDSLGKLLKIRPKDIQHVIQTKYVFKDSIQEHVKYIYTKDTISKTINFIASKDCYTVRGTSSNDTVRLTKIELNDILTTFMYKTYEHKFLFIRWSKYYTAKVYSACMHDTISVTRNIKIVKNITD